LKLDFDPRKNMSAFAYYYSKIDNINSLFQIRRIVKNWYMVGLFRAGLKKTIRMKFRDGKSAYFKSKKEYFKFWDTLDGEKELLKNIMNSKIKILKNYVMLRYKNRNLKFNYDTMRQLINTVWVLNENFIELEYDKLKVIDRVVVDIGANIGDTAIYFALKGAKHVYAFEPYPYSYNIAKKNIKLNHLEDRITLLNEGCGKSGFVTIKEEYENTGGTDLKNFEEGKKIRIVSLDEIVRRFNLKHAALKVDCEGCEYDLILNASDEALKAFDNIIIEYHYGYRNLVNRLSNIFRVRFTLPKEKGGLYVGLIRGEK